ncbi:MAG: xanthine dehydrogenase family protein subunit M, partial [Gammaproteobacteria bacterium]|nr:xanthine dehydrogenase family protein subunit M [Gammaproteobacteria bacterium]
MTDIHSYQQPGSLAEATTILAGGGVSILSGGTDLMLQKNLHSGTLMNIRRLEELHGIELNEDTVRIGAMTSITELLESPLIGQHLPILHEAADHFASVQIRNAGTIGGNICNASPAGDTLVPLLVLDAQLELASAVAGRVKTRLLPIDDFFIRPGKTRLQPDELLSAIHIPQPAEGFSARFEKFGSRPALDISTVSIGIGGILRDGKLHQARVAYGAVAPIPLLARKTMAATENQTLDDDGIQTIAAAARDEVSPIDDVRASAW